VVPLWTRPDQPLELVVLDPVARPAGHLTELGVLDHGDHLDIRSTLAWACG
jgi:hypothetical protein